MLPRMHMGALVLTLLVTATAVQAATFNDNDYHEYILYNVDTPTIDVLVLPPVSPYALRDATVIKQGVDAWDEGIDDLGSSWLANGIQINTYIVGFDNIPDEALLDPEIVIISSEHNPVLLFGIGYQVPISWCHGFGEYVGSWTSWVTSLPSRAGFHQHEGAQWGMMSAQCDDGGKQCIVLNTNFLSTPSANNRRYMYDLNTHEVGHCLGIGHVGDALDFSANNYPAQDIMSYQHGNHVHCVSTLNIKALEAVYGGLLGQSSVAQSAGSYVHMKPSAYHTTNCAEPTAGLLG